MRLDEQQPSKLSRLFRSRGFRSDTHRISVLFVIAFFLAFVLWLQIEFGMAEVFWQYVIQALGKGGE